MVGDGKPVELPIESLKTLHKVVHALAGGIDAMLTTTEAADFLGVSRPYLTRLVRSGKLPPTWRTCSYTTWWDSPVP